MTCRNDPQFSDTRAIEMHKPCSYALLFIAQSQEEPFHFEGERGPGVMQKFVKSLEKMAKTIYVVKQQNKYFVGIPTIARTNVENSWICESPVDQSIERKQHAKPSYNSPNHRWKIYSTQNWSFHKNAVRQKQKEMTCIRKHKTAGLFSVHVFISWLWLAKNLPAEAFKLLMQHFSEWPESAVDKLKQKSFFPYRYIDNFDILEESKLPPRSLWTNSLHQFEVNVTQEEYEQAVEVFKIFECSTVVEYYDIYLQTDYFLLAAIVVCFRKVCYERYGLDCCQYYTASNLSGDAMLRTCKAPIELLTQREHLDIVENLISGGISSVYSKRLALANNKYLDYFDAENPSTFIIMIDANNLYGGVMEKFCLTT